MIYLSKYVYRKRCLGNIYHNMSSYMTNTQRCMAFVASAPHSESQESYPVCHYEPYLCASTLRKCFVAACMTQAIYTTRTGHSGADAQANYINAL